MYAKDNTKNLFKLANSVAENFVSNNLSDYQGLRNYDYGPEKRNNVSCLSPFITHRLILEQEIIKRSLDFYPFAKIEKFIQEIYWRTYWKGWLELRPAVWEDFISERVENWMEMQHQTHSVGGGLPASKQRASTILLDHQTYQNLPTVDFIQKD